MSTNQGTMSNPPVTISPPIPSSSPSQEMPLSHHHCVHTQTHVWAHTHTCGRMHTHSANACIHMVTRVMHAGTHTHVCTVVYTWFNGHTRTHMHTCTVVYPYWSVQLPKHAMNFHICVSLTAPFPHRENVFGSSPSKRVLILYEPRQISHVL